MAQSEDRKWVVTSIPHVRHALPYQKKSLKKVKLLHTDNQVQDLPSLPSIIQPPVPFKQIKPPPLISVDLWSDISEQAVLIDESPTLAESIAKESSAPESIEPLEVEETHKNENILDIARKNDYISNNENDEIFPFFMEEDAHVATLYEHKSEHTTNTLLEFEQTPTLEDLENELEQSASLLDDLELLDIDAALAKQEEALFRLQAEKSEAVSRPERGQAPGWHGAVSLIYVNWEHEEEAIQEALKRLGYAELTVSEATREFILQAARVGGLSYQQELQLTTRLATARAQLAQIPPCDDPENDLYATERNLIKATIAELEQTLVYKMQWVAVKKAPQFLGNTIELDDLIQYGMLGVIAGIAHFDSSRQGRLLPVVNMWVFQSLRRAINDYARLIRLPAHVSEQLDTIKKQHLQLQMILGRLPSRRELADAVKISVDRLEMLLDDSKEHLSLDKYRYIEYANDRYSFQAVNDGGVFSQETMRDEEDEIGTKQIIDDLLSCLSARERQTILLRFGLDKNRDPHTLEEVGKVLQVTRERVRQIESRALTKMQRSPIARQVMGWQTGKGIPSTSKADEQQVNERSKKTKKAEQSIPKFGSGRPQRVGVSERGV
jgi:RNA polymerase sigma factor (sigma-70 family)